MKLVEIYTTSSRNLCKQFEIIRVVSDIATIVYAHARNESVLGQCRKIAFAKRFALFVSKARINKNSVSS